MKKVFVGVVLTAITLAACMGDSSTESTQALSSDPAACVTEAAQKHLTCTANDVRVAEAVSISIAGGGPLECTAGSTVSFTAVFRIALNTTARLDPRFFFGVDGDPNGDGALSGTCASSIISPPTTNLDGDGCGDVNTPNEFVTVTLNDVACVDNDGDGHLDLPTCTSWKQPGSDTVCNTAVDTAPGSPSKCSCDAGFDVPITVKPPEAAVVKSYVSLLCSSHRYNVVVNNASETQTLTLTSLADSTYGDLFTVHGDTTAGPAVLATTCATAVMPVGGSTACSFDGFFCGPTETDVITATLDDGASTVIERVSNSLTVDVAATAH